MSAVLQSACSTVIQRIIHRMGPCRQSAGAALQSMEQQLGREGFCLAPQYWGTGASPSAPACDASNSSVSGDECCLQSTSGADETSVQSGMQARHKSLKRRAAEALLAARYSEGMSSFEIGPQAAFHCCMPASQHLRRMSTIDQPGVDRSQQGIDVQGGESSQSDMDMVADTLMPHSQPGHFKGTGYSNQGAAATSWVGLPSNEWAASKHRQGTGRPRVAANALTQRHAGLHVHIDDRTAAQRSSPWGQGPVQGAAVGGTATAVTKLQPARDSVKANARESSSPSPTQSVKQLGGKMQPNISMQAASGKRPRSPSADSQAERSAKRYESIASWVPAESFSNLPGKELPGIPHVKAPPGAETTAVHHGRGVEAHSDVCAASWCKFPVVVPSIDWQQAFESNPQAYTQFLPTKDRKHVKYFMGQGLQAVYLGDARHVPEAVRHLRDTMQDPVLAIDLEWQPDMRGTNHKVALMQIASGTTCLLLHVASMNFVLPASVRALLSDPTVQLVGFGWGGADEHKMRATFHCGREDFGSFHDLQEIASELGWDRNGLSLDKFTKKVLGFGLNKSKRTSRSQWHKALGLNQIKYAALDAFATGQVFRGIRLWHNSPAPCPGCKVPLGAVVVPMTMACSITGRAFTSFDAYISHCGSPTYKQNAVVCKCKECGRVVPSINVQAAAGSAPSSLPSAPAPAATAVNAANS